MAIPDPYNDIDEALEEGDLTTTAHVLSAREILDRLERDAADQQESESPPNATSWWQRLLSWLGFK